MSGRRSDRRERLVKLSSALAFLAVAVVAVLIVISQGQSGGGDADSIEGAGEVDRLLDGLRQEGLTLGEPTAKVTLVEFGDLQCPTCKAYSEEILPSVIEGPVRSGKTRLVFGNYTIVGTESTPAAAAAAAAGRQGRGWSFVELFYRNQSAEETGYVTDEFLTAIARAAGVPDLAQWSRDRKSTAVLAEVEADTAEAQKLGFNGTPSFAIEGPATEGLEALGLPTSAGDLEEAIVSARL